MGEGSANLSAARVLAAERFPYLSAALYAWVFLEDTTVLSVSKKLVVTTPYYVLRYHPDWLKDKDKNRYRSAQELALELVHHTWHVLSDHAKRRLGRHPQLWGAACCLAVDTMLGSDEEVRAALKKAGHVFPSDIGLEENLTPEAYYSALYEKFQDAINDLLSDLLGGKKDGGQDQKGSAGKQKGAKETGQDGQGGQGKQDGQDSRGGVGGGKQDGQGGGQQAMQMPAEASQTAPCGFDPTASDPGREGRTPTEVERISRDVAFSIRKEGEARGKGSIPGTMMRWAEILLRPPAVDWRREFACLLSETVSSTPGATAWTWKKPNRRVHNTEIFIPGLHHPYQDVAVIVDTSGSMSDRDLAEAMAEVSGIIKASGGQILFCSADAHIQSRLHVRSPRQALLAGGGGTSMATAVKQVAKYRPRPAAIVVITDGVTDWPSATDARRIPVFWVIVGDEQVSPPWGKVFRMDDLRRAKEA